MTSVELCRVADDQVVGVLTTGDHIIGRGSLLQCTNKNVSRNHGIIRITENGVTITPTHVNPCYFMSENNNTLVILTKDTPVVLKSGDQFGLLRNQYWFKVQLYKNCKVTNNCVTPEEDIESITRLQQPKENEPITQLQHLKEVESIIQLQHPAVKNSLPVWLKKVEVEFKVNTQPVILLTDEMKTIFSQSDPVKSKKLKRKPNTDKISPPLKMLKVSSIIDDKSTSVNNNNCNITNDISAVQESTLQQVIISEISKIDKEKNMDFSMLSNSVDLNTDNKCSKEVVTELLIETDACQLYKLSTAINASQDNNKAGVSQDSGDEEINKRKRNRCWYGATCYRKNVDHKKEYSHPGDVDYDENLADNNQVCSYGTKCYRRNIEHLEKYNHDIKPEFKTKNRNQNKKKRNCSATTSLNTTDYNELSLDDDYDLEDPFIDDGSEDEYRTESDSDSDSSVQNESNDEDITGLIKEAKRFKSGGKYDL